MEDNRPEIKTDPAGKNAAGNDPGKAKMEDRIARCFTMAFEHQADDRDWKSIEDLNRVPPLVKTDHLTEAMAILDANAVTYADFDFIYAWKASIYQRQQMYDRAGEILTLGLEKAKAKHLLCDRLGYLHAELGAMETAVSWWVKSITLMSTGRARFIWEPFLYMAYVAKNCDCPKEYQILYTIASQVHGTISLTPEAEKDLEKKTRNLNSEFVPMVIRHLCKKYLAGRFAPSRKSKLEPQKRLPADSYALPGKTTTTQEHRINLKWTGIAIAAAIAAVVLIFLLLASGGNPNVPDKKDGLTGITKQTMPQDNNSPASQPQKPKPADIKPPVTEQDPPPPETPAVKTDTSRPVQKNIPQEHKTKAGYLKQKTKQPGPNLQKK